MRSFCAADVSSGLAARVMLVRVSRGWLGGGIAGAGPAYEFIFVLECLIVVGLRFKWHSLHCTLSEIYMPVTNLDCISSFIPSRPCGS